jgi:hypothetical protein
VRGYDLATGTQLWECAGLTDNVVSSPVFSQGVVIAGNSYYQQAMLAIRLAGAKGDLTGTDRVAGSSSVTRPMSPQCCSDDTLYVIQHNQNVLSRLDPMTGHPRGEPLRPTASATSFASPVSRRSHLRHRSRRHDGRSRHDLENAMLAVNELDDSFSASALVDKDSTCEGKVFFRIVEK